MAEQPACGNLNPHRPHNGMASSDPEPWCHGVVPRFFDEGEHPTVDQMVLGIGAAFVIDSIMEWGHGGGKTWLLARVVRYIQRVDPAAMRQVVEGTG